MANCAPPGLSWLLLMVILLLFLLVILFLLAQFNLITLVFESLGISRWVAVALLGGSVIGSAINIPLRPIKSYSSDNQATVAINLGGCVIPVGFAIYLIVHLPLAMDTLAICLLLVTAACYAFSHVERGMGVMMPALIAPMTAAVAALWLSPGLAAPMAYISGTLGALIGADLLRLRQATRSGAGLMAIGGAGTFDGIFLSGLLAVLLT